MMASFNAIVPMLCVTAAAHRRDGRRGVPRAGRADADRPARRHRPGRARRSRRCLLWNHNASSFGVVAADNFGLFVTGILIVVGLLSLAFSGADDRARAPAARRVLRADAVRDRRHDADGDGDRSARHLPRARSRCRSPSTCSRASGATRRARPRRRSSISCSARSRARSSSTASRSRTA